ncbi:acyl-CoA N-acyltransferase [Trichodelitschia bisporula]|uniref:Acyl-CoA N-acyltransferase n=1 Tax=Trichodelitschia bisporula TaxID=703511 RepID=A0A6G1HI40_9PEZI|nr:acyl-CoA N-acyltransferase [Trichodelitschia bisporula]
MYATTLTTNDAEACVLLENEAFPENLRATREKILYRLRENSGLCLGIKATVFPNHHSSTPYRTMATFPVAVKFADTTTRRPSKFQPRSSILLGHVICTLSESKVINDAGMALPPDWETATSYQTKYPELGNKPLGRTLCIHSLAVLEGVRDFGVASLLLNELAKRMKTHDVVDRIALICEGKLVKFYQSRGFKKVGESDVKFGGVPWFDMVRELSYLDA